MMGLAFWRRKKNIDPESQELWRKFKESQACWVCDYLQGIHNKTGMAALFLQTADEKLAVTKIHFCPQCGRRLVYKRCMNDA